MTLRGKNNEGFFIKNEHYFGVGPSSLIEVISPPRKSNETSALNPSSQLYTVRGSQSIAMTDELEKKQPIDPFDWQSVASLNANLPASQTPANNFGAHTVRCSWTFDYLPTELYPNWMDRIGYTSIPMWLYYN